MPSRLKTILLSVLGFTVLFTYYSYLFPSYTLSIFDTDYRTEGKFIDWEWTYRSCLIKHAKDTLVWGNTSEWIESCDGDMARETFGAVVIRHRDDVKLVIRPQDAPNDDPSRTPSITPCAVVTFGVGHIVVDRAIKKLRPECEFHGFDPRLEKGSAYDSVGVYYEIAVGAKSGKYIDHKIKVPMVTMLEAFQEVVRTPRVDYVFMDIGGPEYELVSQFFHSGELSLNNITVCQLQVHFPAPLAKYGMSESGYKDMVNTLVTNSPYLPIWAREGDGERIFFVNTEHPDCVGIYLRDAFTNE